MGLINSPFILSFHEANLAKLGLFIPTMYNGIICIVYNVILRTITKNLYREIHSETLQ